MSINITSTSIVELNIVNATLTQLVDASLLQAVANAVAGFLRTVLAVGIVTRNLTKHSTHRCNEQDSGVQHRIQGSD